MLFHSSVAPNPSHPSSSASHANNPAHPNPHAAANANTANGSNMHAAPPQPTRTLLSVLRADELTILNRKANIRRFGAGWLRPMGVGKTLQGMADEMAEREEAAAGGREFVQANQHSASPTASPHGSPPSRDLDDDVPNADDPDAAWVDEDEDEDEDEEDHGGDEDLDLDLDHPMEEEDDVLAGERDDDEGDGDYAPEPHDIDLDAEIPEAEGEGGYEHTDTEVEDESSFDIEYGGDGVLGRSVWGTGGEGMGGRIGGGVGSTVTSSIGVGVGVGVGVGDEVVRMRRTSAGGIGGEAVLRGTIRISGRGDVMAGNVAGGIRRSSRGGGGGGRDGTSRSTTERRRERERGEEN